MLIIENVTALQGRVSVRSLAAVELCMAAAAALEPESGPLSMSAHRVLGRIPPAASRTLDELNARLPQWPRYASNTFHRLGIGDLRRALMAFANEDPLAIARDSAGHAGIDGSPALDSVAGRAPALREVRRFLLRPQPFVVQINAVLAAFASAGFETWWQQRYSERRGEFPDPRVDNDLRRAAKMLSPTVVDDVSHDRLIFLGGSDSENVDCAGIANVTLLPTPWLRREPVVYRAPGRVGISVRCVPYRRGEFGDLEVPAMLTALADQRRFEILRLCLLRPRTTSELAPILGITEGPVSRHLKELENSGLISSERLGRHVWYWTSIEALSLLGQHLQGLPQEVWTEAVAREDAATAV